MSELRKNIITREWVIIAPERAKRPEEFKKSTKEKKELPAYSPSCPFCRGNENMTPQEVYSLKKGKNWKVRVVPNKFPALSSSGSRSRNIQGIWQSMNGVGIHEVIIETPSHNLTTAQLSVKEVEDIIKAYRSRYLAAKENKKVEMVIIFKNHGESAGTSLEHSHSQLIATPVVPAQIRYRLEEAMRFCDDTDKCVYCWTMEEELRVKERIILESEHFVVFVPFAAYSPFHTWIFPKRHSSSFGKIKDAEIKDLAGVLKTLLAKFYYGLSNPDYNYVIRSIPVGEGEVAYFHWYISIILRLTKTAGFELGSGMYINTSLPEENAYFLRNLKV